MSTEELVESIRSAHAAGVAHDARKKHPPGAPLEYYAERAYWHAANLAGFEGTQAAWVALVATGSAEAAAAIVGSSPREPNLYEQKQEARRERLIRRSKRASAEAAAASASAARIADAIPFGQPVLVGHHSERRHRRDIEKIRRGFERAAEAEDRAEGYARAADAVGTAGISSDDPDAIEKLRAELAREVALRAAEKLANKAVKRAAAERMKALGRPLTATDHLEIVAAHVPVPLRARMESAARAFAWLPQFGPNTAARVKRLEERIALLEKRDATAEREPMKGTSRGIGFVLEENARENRVQITFDEKPGSEVCAALRGRGFKFSRQWGCWQRMRSNAAWRAALDVLEIGGAL